MRDGLVIIWAATRAPLPREARLLSDVTRAMGGKVRTIAVSSLGREILASMVEGPVVVVVSSRKDASAALSLGADEIVRVAQSVTLRKSTIESAITRACARSGARAASASAAPAAAICPALGILMRAVEPRLGRPLATAATACAELAGELTRVVAIADGLVQQVQQGAKREVLNGWFSEVKDYAQATLRIEALATTLEQEVRRGDAVLKWLGSLAFDSWARETDVAQLLESLAEFVQRDLPPSVVCEFVRDRPCSVGVSSRVLLPLVCEAIALAFENILAGSGAGRVTLRTSMADGEAAIDVADDGPPGSSDLRLTVRDLVLSDERTARLRALREQTRRAGGELFVEAECAGNVISFYLPALSQSDLASVRRATSPRWEGSNR
jgi:hypothetical protein